MDGGSPRQRRVQNLLAAIHAALYPSTTAEPPNHKSRRKRNGGREKRLDWSVGGSRREWGQTFYPPHTREHAADITVPRVPGQAGVGASKKVGQASTGKTNGFAPPPPLQTLAGIHFLAIFRD